MTATHLLRSILVGSIVSMGSADSTSGGGSSGSNLELETVPRYVHFSVYEDSQCTNYTRDVLEQWLYVTQQTTWDSNITCIQAGPMGAISNDAYWGTWTWQGGELYMNEVWGVEPVEGYCGFTSPVKTFQASSECVPWAGSYIVMHDTAVVPGSLDMRDFPVIELVFNNPWWGFSNTCDNLRPNPTDGITWNTAGYVWYMQAKERFSYRNRTLNGMSSTWATCNGTSLEVSKNSNSISNNIGSAPLLEGCDNNTASSLESNLWFMTGPRVTLNGCSNEAFLSQIAEYGVDAYLSPFASLPTSAPTASPTTVSPTTSAPTQSPTTFSPTTSAPHGPPTSSPTTSSPTTSSGGSGGNCFPKSARVELESGESVQMSEVAIGDRIKVATDANSGAIEFASVVFLPHARDNAREAVFVTIETSGGHSITATEDHFLVATTSCAQSDDDTALSPVASLLEAGKIMVGMCLRRIRSRSMSGDSIEWEEVTDVRVSRDIGVYTVVTSNPSGLLVVDGFAASSFGTNHDMANLYYHAVRFLARVLPGWVFGVPAVVATNQMVGDVAWAVHNWAR